MIYLLYFDTKVFIKLFSYLLQLLLLDFGVLHWRYYTCTWIYQFGTLCVLATWQQKIETTTTLCSFIKFISRSVHVGLSQTSDLKTPILTWLLVCMQLSFLQTSDLFFLLYCISNQSLCCNFSSISGIRGKFLKFVSTSLEVDSTY